MTEAETIKKLRWHCRRGLLELDFLLAKFLENEYATLSSEEKSDFERLLEHSDPELLGWLTISDSDVPKEFKKIVHRFRFDSKDV